MAADEGKQASKTEKPAEQKSEAASSKTKQKAASNKLSGAELYSMHCNRCHPERYPTERTAAQWKTILLHMRGRANLPAEQARTILKYLQDNSGR
jgi:cytochrome c5